MYDIYTSKPCKMRKKELVEISIIIPCRNEEKFIGTCLDSIIANNYPKDKLEILVVDGMSEDETRAIVEGYARLYPHIKLLENPKKITPCALNTGIRNAIGNVIIRMDAHSVYPASYISTCIEHLNKTGADVVGGPIITKPSVNTLMAKAIALLTSHPFGVGNSRFRTSLKEGYVDTVPFGAYRKEILQKVGLFDKRLIRGEDNELCSRIIRNGGKIYLTPELTTIYYNQATFQGLLKQALHTGMRNVYTLWANPAAFRWRHFVPFIFVTAFLGFGLLIPLHYFARLGFFILIGLYGGVAGVSSLQIGIREGMKYTSILPIIFFLYHVCYGLGTWGGVLKVFIGWDSTSNNRGKVKT